MWSREGSFDMECKEKALAFDAEHKAVRWGKSHAGAKELAGGYTKGTPRSWLVLFLLICYS